MNTFTDPSLILSATSWSWTVEFSRVSIKKELCTNAIDTIYRNRNKVFFVPNILLSKFFKSKQEYEAIQKSLYTNAVDMIHRNWNKVV